MTVQKLLIGIAGIYIAYITMSGISEGIYSTQFMPSNPQLPPAKFSYPSLLVWLGGLFCFIAGSIISKINKQKANPIPIKQRIIMGGLFTLNMTTTSYALLYISYPIQIIGRNIRFLFVVIVGALFSRVKSHHKDIKLKKSKIFMAFIITFGVLLFYFAKSSKKQKGDSRDPSKQWIGYTLLLVSVIADALFSDSQAYSKASFKPTANQLFTVSNLFAFIFCAIFAVYDQSFLKSIYFIVNYPSAAFQVTLLCLLQVLGQISIYYVVANFKQHMFPLISTTRKIISVLFSIFWFNHTITLWQWVAILIVFIGMFFELYEELSNKNKSDHKHHKVQHDKNDKKQAQNLLQDNKKQ